jgi:hypothetical protein
MICCIRDDGGRDPGGVCHRPAASRGFGGVHRLDLRMLRAEALNHPDAEQAVVRPEAEHGDRRIERPFCVEREAVLGRVWASANFRCRSRSTSTSGLRGSSRGDLMLSKPRMQSMRPVFQRG